jgi:hypothetical protein
MEETLTQPCNTKVLLMNVHQDMVLEYSHAIAELSKKIWAADREECNKLTLVTNRVRTLALKAHEQFEAHVDEHGC